MPTQRRVARFAPPMIPFRAPPIGNFPPPKIDGQRFKTIKVSFRGGPWMANPARTIGMGSRRDPPIMVESLDSDLDVQGATMCTAYGSDGVLVSRWGVCGLP
jgi:hypothetical protein